MPKSSSHPTNKADSANEDSFADDLPIDLAPYIQTYLNQTKRKYSCCSVMLPVAFERVAPKSWLDPKFDTSVLEEQFQTSVFPHVRMRYRFTLFYILICSLAWFLYFLIDGGSEDFWRPISSSFSMISLITFMAICFTHCEMYRSHKKLTSAITAIALCTASLIFLTYTGRAFSPLGHFAICLEIVLLIYTALPMPIYLSATIAISYSVLFELVTHMLVGSNGVHGDTVRFSYKILILRILLHFSVHLVSIHVMVMNVVRMRGTFMKVGQNLLVRRQLEMEKQLKEKMIHSVMPPKVADLLMNEGGIDVGDNSNLHYIRPRTSNDVKSLFRPFHMHSMENVSIIFADIVGFTRMSSNKTAEQLVEILNDLFERFDDLCTLNGCEKISTLGDCYYCVSGCPEPRPDHAICCVEMGLGMIEAMRVFDSQRNEGVKMRVGIHTGSVLCGIVGTRRVKFDVWSNDVSLANKMESTGKPEQIHISEATASFLNDFYYLEEGDEVFGHRTYFVVGRKTDVALARRLSASMSQKINNPNMLHPDHPKTLSQSATNISIIHSGVMPASPVGQLSTSLNPSPVLAKRPRLYTFTTKLRKKSQVRQERDIERGIFNPTAAGDVLPIMVVRERPKIIVTTKSLPGSLDSEEKENTQDHGCFQLSTGDKSEKAYSTEGEQHQRIKFKMWKKPQFLRRFEDPVKHSDKSVNTDISFSTLCTKTPCNEEVGNSTESNGYTPLPLVIEAKKSTTMHMLQIPQKNSFHHTLNPTGTEPNNIQISRSPETSCCYSPAQNSIYDDIIDVRSYISQSRSDISPFDRSGSYRSQCGRNASLYSETSPMPQRQRAITLSTDQQVELCPLQPLIGQLQPSTQLRQSLVCPDGLSICASATSRKDSGIKSTSRRSSIQQQIYALNQAAISQNRVSGYFTSSASSLSNMGDTIRSLPQASPTVVPQTLPSYQSQQPALPGGDPLAACLQQLRKQSDLQLIRCVRDNAESQRRYLVKPPLKRFSLFFKSSALERDFRSKAHRFGNESEIEGPPTLATPRYNTYLDIFVGLAVYLCISISLFMMTPSNVTPSFSLWVALFSVFTTIQIFALFLFTRQMCRRHSLQRTKLSPQSCADRIFEAISSWYPWHICLAVLMAMPVILIIANFLLLDLDELEAFEYHYGFLIFVCIVHFCNFTQLNCWMRNILAFLAAMSFVGIAVTQLTVYSKRVDALEASRALQLNDTSNTTASAHLRDLIVIEEMKWFQDYHVEIYLDLLLILILVWLLNRELEIGYRLTFYGNAVANKDKVNVQNMKNQADLLLHNIIPKHVAEHLKNTAKYSENHHNVGIIFGSVVNFNEMYDESYLGGKEYLRVLNELIGDFDELLSRKEFACVEKIKTIGSTFMAASGLDPSNRGHNDEHIHSLMEFSIAMQEVVDAFNKDLLEFNLILRIGFNVGDVTAGVIGTSKLYYDIWGDAVNVASRMDSTGVPNRIQVGKDCLPFLESKYMFEPRGSVYVKGKDNMEVFLLTQRRPEVLNEEKNEQTSNL